MRSEVDLFGVYLPPLLFVTVLAWLLTVLLSRVLNRLGAYRLVWHRPLVNVALYVIVLGASLFAAAAVLDRLLGTGA